MIHQILIKSSLHILILLIWLLLPLTAISQHITYEASNQSLKSVLNDLKRLHKVHFSYDSQQIQPHQISISAQSEDLKDFLERMLRPLGLGFQMHKNNYIAIRPVSQMGLQLNLKILDKDNQTNLAFASIQIKGTQKGVVTNDQGYTTLQIANPDTTQLLISYMGYKTLEINALELYKLNLEVVHLERSQTELQEITILESIQKLSYLEDDLFSINIFPQETNTSLGLGTPDLQYNFQLIPGISTSLSTANHLQIRGSRDDQGLIYWDRIPIYHPTHHFGTLSSIIPNMVERVNVYRGAPPVKFGGVSSGLIEMLAPSEIPEDIDIITDLDMTQAAIHVALPFKKYNSAAYFAIRNSDNHWLNTPTFRSFQERLFDTDRNTLSSQINYSDNFQYSPSQSRLRFADYQFKWINQLNSSTHYSVSGFFSRNSQEFLGNYAVLADSSHHHHQVSNKGVNFYWQKKLNQDWQSNLSVSFTRYLLHHESIPFSWGNLNENQETYQENTMSNLEINAEAIYQISDQESVSMGIQTNHIHSWADLQRRDSLTRDIDHEIESNGGIYSAFINHSWHKNPRLRIETGVRFQYFHFLKEYRWNPNLKIFYEATNWWQLKFGYAVYDQYLHSLSDIEFNVNPLTENIWILTDDVNLPLLVNAQLTFGGVFNHEGWLLDTEVYYKNLKRMVILNLEDQLTEESSEASYFKGTGDIWGLDILLSKKIKGYEGMLSYSFVKANHVFKDFYDTRFPGFWDTRHQIKFSQELKLGAFDFSLIWSYQSGLPYSQPAGLVIEEDSDPSESHIGIEWKDINTERLPAIHRLDASVWYQFKNKKSSYQGQIGLSLLNIYQNNSIWSRVFYPKTFIENGQASIHHGDRRAIPFTLNLSSRFVF